MHIGERIRQAREIRGLTQDDLADLMVYKKSQIGQVEAGFRSPSRAFLESVALALKFPLSYFDEAPHLEFPIEEVLFRGPRKIKRRSVLEAVRSAEHVFSVYLQLSRRLHEVPSRLIDSHAPPQDAARELKRALDLPTDLPQASLIRTLERAGIAMLVIPSMENGDAFSVWVSRPDGPSIPVIAFNLNSDSFDRTRLSIAHELGHLVCHRSFLRKPHAEIEEEAFNFGAEWLMPTETMKKVIKEPVTLTSLARLKPIWGVSIAALVRRAMELQLITQRQYHYLFQQLAAQGWKTKEPTSLEVAAEKPRLLRKMAEMIYGENIDFDAFAAETKLSSQELRRMMGDYGTRVDNEHPLRTNVVRFAR